MRKVRLSNASPENEGLLIQSTNGKSAMAGIKWNLLMQHTLTVNETTTITNKQESTQWKQCTFSKSHMFEVPTPAVRHCLSVVYYLLTEIYVAV